MKNDFFQPFFSGIVIYFFTSADHEPKNGVKSNPSDPLYFSDTILTRAEKCAIIKLLNLQQFTMRKDNTMEERFQTFTVLISKLNRCIRKIKTVEMAEFNLKSPHVSCLYYLYKSEALTAKELCDICEEDKANISRSIEFLENGGYIVGRPKTGKRYKSPLIMTEKGKEAGELIVRKIDSILDAVSQVLSEENRQNMYASLSVICDNLQKICDAYGEHETEK